MVRTVKFQTKTDVQALLAGAGIRPRRRWGQNFLIDGNLLGRLLDAASPGPHDTVLEVGVGTGTLTEHLVRLASKVVAVEIDRALHAIVADRLAGAGNLTLIHGDVLSSKHHVAGAVQDAIETAMAATDAERGDLLLVANLPYNIATPLLIDLLVGPFGFARFCFTVQRELADRLCATPRTKDWGPVSVLVQATCSLSRVAELSPSVFWPRPAVRSTMLRVDVSRNPFGTPEGLTRFAELVRGSFRSRRKTLKHNLPRAIGEDRCRSLSGAIDLSRRPEELTVEEWVEFATLVDADPARPRVGGAGCQHDDIG